MLKKIFIASCGLGFLACSGGITPTTSQVTAQANLTSCESKLTGYKKPTDEQTKLFGEQAKALDEKCNADDIAEFNKSNACILEKCNAASDFDSFEKAAYGDGGCTPADPDKLSDPCKAAMGAPPGGGGGPGAN